MCIGFIIAWESNWTVSFLVLSLGWRNSTLQCEHSIICRGMHWSTWPSLDSMMFCFSCAASCFLPLPRACLGFLTRDSTSVFNRHRQYKIWNSERKRKLEGNKRALIYLFHWFKINFHTTHWLVVLLYFVCHHVAAYKFWLKFIRNPANWNRKKYI